MDEDKNLSFKIGNEKKLSVDNKGNIIFNPMDEDIGGFRLNGNNSSDLFWNNSLFTNNTIKRSSSKYEHYVSFLRSVGTSSKKETNVFLGVKSIVNNDPTFPSSSSWSDNSNYKFYIRFNGEVYSRATVTLDRELISKGGIHILSKNLDDDNWLGNFSITGSKTFLTMDSNMIACVKNVASETEYEYSNMYIKAYAFCPIEIEKLSGTDPIFTSLGNSTHRWRNIYASDADIPSLALETAANVSDMRLKSTESSNHLLKILSIYNNLNPVAYKYKNLQETDNHSRIHTGFIAQYVEDALLQVGLTESDCAFLEKIKTDNDDYNYYLNYNEFHGLHVLKNQEQDSRIQELEDKVQELEKQILELRGKGV